MVSISGDGTRIASGWVSYSGKAHPIYLHEWNSGSQSWTDISPSELIGLVYIYAPPVISRDGTRVAFIENTGGALQTPALNVYEIGPPGTNMNTNGTQVGTGKDLPYGPSSMAISADGSRVVIGWPEFFSGNGMIRVYEWMYAWGSGGGYAWTEPGSYISGAANVHTGRLGSSVAISADGIRVAAGAPGQETASLTGALTGAGYEPYVQVWEWNSGSLSWQQLGSDVTMGQTAIDIISGKYDYHFGQSVDISDDGSLVAVGAMMPSTLHGSTRLYKLNSTTNVWRMISSEIEEENGSMGVGAASISLSGDGKYVAVGANMYFTGYGRVRVYKDPSLAQDSPAPATPAPPSSNSSSSSCSSSRATGGTITTFGDYVIHNFSSNSSFQVTDSSLTEVEVLVVGGGGGGGGAYGGGGGGGAVLYSANKTLSSGSITVTVGNGGTGGQGGFPEGNGRDSAFDGMVATGGWAPTDAPFESGGTSGSGESGGNPVDALAGGGGGGAGGQGEAAKIEKPGDGGPGVQSDISGTSGHYGGGGGGGGAYVGHAGNGGLGGGGSGSGQSKGTPGSAFTGGGGGGGGGGGAQYIGGSGGSGIVIVRYKSATCNDQSCATDYYHDGASCVACPTGSNRLPDTANQCLCPKDSHRKVDGGVYSCVACAQGSTRPAGDTVPGGDATTCSAGSSALPSASPSSPTSAQDKKAAAEKTRDSILADIADARLKAKAKLLADAAIAGVKVQRLTAKLSAADEDAACSTAFTKAEMSASDGACVAKAASSGKRRLSATTYDVEIMFSSAVVSDDALTKAADALKANGVEGVTSKTSVDPIAELKVIPGIDTSKLQTFDKEATEAAAAAPSVSTPPPPPPPPPPSPPPPNIVQDDDDAATGHRGVVAIIAVAAVLLLQ